MPWQAHEVERVRNLWEEGKSIKQIARITGWSINQITYLRNTHKFKSKWTKPDKKDPSRLGAGGVTHSGG